MTALLGVWAVVRVFGLERGFPGIPLIAYTPYVAGLATLAAAIIALLRRWPQAALAGAAALALAFAVAPRALGGGDRSAEGVGLTVLSSNLRHGGADAETIVDLVREHHVDLLSVQELSPKDVAAFRRVGLGRLLPHAVLNVRRGSVGGGLYSRFPLRRLTEPVLQFKQPRALVAVPGAGPVEVVSVHPKPPLRSAIGDWKGGLRWLPAAGDPGRQLLAGDFNATLDHAELRRILDSGYADAADRVGAGLIPTWPADRLWPPPVTIDHILVESADAVRDCSVHRVQGTDHRAVLCELVLVDRDLG